MKLNHIGYLTDSIENTAKQFELLGYSIRETVADDTQRTRICFLTQRGLTDIELVEPYTDNKTMLRMLKKQGVGPYHLCYECDDIMVLYDEMVAKDFVPLFKPIAAPAFGNRLICYFFKQEMGFIEFVNNK